MRIRGPIYGLYHQLMPEVGLNVYVVVGAHSAALIDSGIAPMKPQITELLAEAQVRTGALDWLLVTHAHVDHIGCNAAIKAEYHPKIAAHRIARPWLEDYDLHYREFAVFAPDILPDNPTQRAATMQLMGEPAAVDITIQEGTEIYLGGDVVLTAFHLPGHKPEELGFFEHSSRTLILGDAIVCMDLPFFHGHLDGTAIRSTIHRLPKLVRELGAQQVLMAHYQPMDAREFLALVVRAQEHITAISNACLDAVRDDGAVSLGEIFLSVCRRMKKQPEFHGLSAVMAEVEYLEKEGLLRKKETGGFMPSARP